MDTTTWSTSTTLLAGAAGGALFAGLAYAFPRRTRGILARGLIVTAFLYVYFAARAHAGPAWLAAELAGVAIYGAMALRGLRGSAWWLVAGWALHPVWDVAVHLIGPGRAFAPTAFANFCLTWDPIVAGVVAAGVLLQARRDAAERAPGVALRTEWSR